MTFEVAGASYDRFMGRYSRPLAAKLTEWLAISPGQRALDVGCGPGAWTAVLADVLGAENVAAIDPSPQFVEACRERVPGISVQQGVAASLPYPGDSFDLAGANLVVHFMPDPVAGLTEMGRVVRGGGLVAATTWDLAGTRAPMAPVWRAIAAIHPEWPGESGLPGGGAGQLGDLLTHAGLSDVTEVEIPVTVTHPTFDEWWEPYLQGVGPIGEALANLTAAEREAVRAACRAELGDGPFEITATAYAARGRV